MSQTHTATSMNASLFAGVDRQIRSLSDEEITISVENLNLYYAKDQALKSVTMAIPAKRVTAFILYVPRRTDRVRGHHASVHQSEPEGDRGLHHRPLWLVSA